jgi:hypothetical protein
MVDKAFGPTFSKLQLKQLISKELNQMTKQKSRPTTPTSIPGNKKPKED